MLLYLHCLGGSRCPFESLCDMHTEDLKNDGCMYSSLLSEDHYQLLDLGVVEGEAVFLALVCQSSDLLSLYAVLSLLEMRTTTVLSAPSYLTTFAGF